MVLNFWATWCVPCINEIPDLIRLQEKYGPDGLTVVGISIDNSTDGSTAPAGLVSSFAANHGMNHPIVMTRPKGYAVENLYGGIPFIPNTFIINRQNGIEQTLGGTQTYDTFERAILPLLYGDVPVKVSFSEGQAHIQWPAKQVQFTVQTSSDLAGNDWTTAAAGIQTDGPNQFIDVPAEPTAQFFRLQLP